jgi:UDP-N-acetylglucosamine transferase subunit ALG13
VSRAPLLLVAVGTDCHPFTRLVRWVDGWLEAQGRQAPPAFVQHGSSPAPRRAEGAAFLDHADMQRLLADSQVVVCHGGPATILEARRAGRLPLVVPRDPRLNEHIDDHQQRFAGRLAGQGLIVLCKSEGELHGALDRAARRPDTFRLAGPGVEAGPPGVQRAGQLIDAMLAENEHRRGSRGLPAYAHRRLRLRESFMAHTRPSR